MHASFDQTPRGEKETSDRPRGEPLSRSTQRQIGKRLQVALAEACDAPIPAKFEQLIAVIAKRTQSI